MTVQILIGDCRERLGDLSDESAHCVVTSPPYWGLRDYNVPPSVWGGDTDCDHVWGDVLPARPGRGNKPGELSTSSLTNPERQDSVPRPKDAGQFCQRCGAWYGVLGLEPDYRLHVAHLVEVMREVRRVLRPDGTVWLNYGDCYAASAGTGAQGTRGQRFDRRHTQETLLYRSTPQNGLKPKDLVMLPARVALALQDDGWWLRSDIIWHKPNPMPESVTDRPTSAHEHVFLLAKSARYYFDAEAVREIALNEERIISYDGTQKNTAHENRTYPGAKPRDILVAGRNIRNVWTIATAPYADAHFATFPPALVEPCIKAGCLEGGTVLDPFGGAGTVGLVADRLGRDAILIELNPDYAAMARQRIRDDQGMFGSVEVAA